MINLRVKVVETTKRYPLNIRSGPSKSYSIIGTLGRGAEAIVDNVSVNGNWSWHHIENRGWVCHQEPGVSYPYTTVIANLEQPAPPKPTPPPPKPRDYTPITNAAATSDINKFNTIFDSALNKNSRGASDAVPLDITTGGRADRIQWNADRNERLTVHDYTIDTSFLEDNVDRIKRNLNIKNNVEGSYLSYSLYHQFNRFKTPFVDEQLTKSFSHVFFTRPDLNLLDYNNGDLVLNSQVENEPLFYYLHKNHPELLASLTNQYTSKHDFFPKLSNAAESFEVSDEFVKTTEHGETFTGYKVQYGKNLIESQTAGTFSISYVDDKNFAIYKIHKAWIEYISKVYRGELKSKREYIQKKVLDYACSVYYIVCAEDGETILFWTKYYGVFPTNTPSSTSSWSKGSFVSFPQYSINYAYAFKEDFSPLSLAEFNMNSRTDLLYRWTYEPTLGSTGTTMTAAPFIETSKNAEGGYVFKLRFRHRE